MSQIIKNRPNIVHIFDKLSSYKEKEKFLIGYVIYVRDEKGKNFINGEISSATYLYSRFILKIINQTNEAQLIVYLQADNISKI